VNIRSRPRVELAGAFEGTYQPQHDVDIAESTQHATRWRSDLQLLLDIGIRTVRYPIRWHRVAAERGSFDWSHTDEVLVWMRDHDMRPVVDLIHHMSYPRWLTAGFADPAFADEALRYYEAFAQRYPWIPAYTLFNEPFTTLFLSGSEAVFPPYLHGIGGFIELARNVIPALTVASRMYEELLPRAEHVYVDTCERHVAATPEAEEFTAYANDRRFFIADLFLGRYLDPSRPFIRDVVSNGGEELLGVPSGCIDVLGLDYYAHSQWEFTRWARGSGTASRPGRLDDLIVEYWERYRLPVALGETNIRGHCSDRASWFKYTLEHCHNACERGVPVRWYCWFPTVDSCDWSSLLLRADRDIDPVGVFWLGDDMERHESSMSRAYAQAAAGVAPDELPAYRFKRPVLDWLRGYLPQMSHWEWQSPPDELPCTNAPQVETRVEFPAGAGLEEPPPGAAYEE
jgi:beta-glucosidase/6-phospho-beta-glucosidase/beta-galactosidase